MGKVVSNLQGAFDPKIVVYVEGDDDILVYSTHWFGPMKNQSPSIEFRKTPNGGCLDVVKAVTSLRQISADNVFGIVDRDALANPANLSIDPNHLTLFLESDDSKFRSARPFGDYIRVLSRWELENFLLLDIDVLEDELKHYGSGSARPSLDVLTEALQLADALLPISAAIVWCRRQSPMPQDPPEKFCIDKTTPSGVEAALFGRAEYGALPAAYASVRGEVGAFDAPLAAPSRRWRQVNRILDGKRFLLKLLSLNGGAGEKEVRRFQSRIAERIRIRAAIDAEIHEIVKEFAQAAVFP